MKIFGIILIAALIILGIAAKIVLPAFALNEIKHSFEDDCDTCEFSAENPHITFLSPGISLENVHLKFGRPSESEFDSHMTHIEARVELSELMNHHLRLREVHIDDPVITFIDADGHSKKSEEKQSGFSFEILDLSLAGGNFTYIRNTKGTSAKITAHEIHGTIKNLGTDPELQAVPATAALTARLENTGSLTLSVSSKPFERPLKVDVDMRVKDQNLDDLTAFLKINAGVSLKGIMKNAHGVARVSDQHLTAVVWAEYSGLDVKLEKMYDRSSLSAFFMNLGADLIMKEDNIDKDFEDQKRSVKIQREPNEAIVGFILRGMKEAAIKVAEAGKSMRTK